MLIVGEQRDGKVLGPTWELVTAARQLAGGGRVRLILLGHGLEEVARGLTAYADVAYVDHPALKDYVSDAFLQALRPFRGLPAAAVLLPHTSMGFDLAPRVAVDWNAPAVGNAVGLAPTEGGLLVTRRILNEKLVAELAVVSERPCIVTVRPGTYKPAEPSDSLGAFEKMDATIDASQVRVRFLGRVKQEVQDIDISTADVIVSAGRGVQKKENLKIVEEFARMVGGVVGASRPLTDMDWLPKTRQVGQSGKSVRPKLYVACGISGAMQHVSGMKDAGIIVAINTDPSAPIFEVAHYGIVGNVLEILPKAMEQLKKG